MSVQWRRRIVSVCIAISVAAIWLNVALVLSGHPGRYTAAGAFCAAVAVVCGLLYLRSTRGRS